MNFEHSDVTARVVHQDPQVSAPVPDETYSLLFKDLCEWITQLSVAPPAQ